MDKEYIVNKISQVGCGYSDIKQLQNICDGLDSRARDVLDGIATLGIDYPNNPDIGIKDDYKDTYLNLKNRFSDDDLECLSAYVSARRNCAEY